MNEREFFDACNEYFLDVRTPSENSRHTFIVIELHEKEENIEVGLLYIDPAMPSQSTAAEAFELSIARHAAIVAKSEIQKVIETAVSETNKLHFVRDLLGADVFTHLLKTTNSSDEFKDKLQKALENLPTKRKLQGIMAMQAHDTKH